KEHWGELNDSQKAEVKGLLRQLIENNYKRNLKKALDYNTHFGTADRAGDETRVKMKATANGGRSDVHIVYVMRPEGSSFRGLDPVTEGSSVTMNYYRQFHEMLTNKDKGYNYLVQKLKDKVARG